MTERLSSYDEHSPLINLGPVQMWLMHDPLGMGKEERYDFSMPLWQLWSTESQFTASLSDKVLKVGSTFNDYYGFGASRDGAINEAVSFFGGTRGTQIKVIVQTKIIAVPVVHDTVTASFYNRSVRCFSLPKWRWKVGDGATVAESCGSEISFCIWENGIATDEAAHVQGIIDKAKASDGASSIRKACT